MTDRSDEMRSIDRDALLADPDIWAPDDWLDPIYVDKAALPFLLGGVDAVQVQARIVIRWLRRIRLARELAARQLPLDVPLKERITVEAARLVESGYGALAALAAAEAIELGREHRIRFDHLTFDEHRLLWEAHYEMGPVRCPGWITMPLEHATEATQAGIAPLN